MDRARNGRQAQSPRSKLAVRSNRPQSASRICATTTPWRDPNAAGSDASRAVRSRQACPSFGDGKDVRQSLERSIDFVARRRAAEAEPDRPHSHMRRGAHRLQNRRQLDAAGMACRSSGSGDPIQTRQYLAAKAADERYVERVRQPVRGMTVEDHAVAELPL